MKLEDKYKVGKDLADGFLNRTSKHIERVTNNAKIIDRAFPGRFVGLLDQVRDHDQSKYDDPECLPYIWLTEFYRCKENNIPFKYPEGMEDRTRQVTLIHIKNNKHHPEYWDLNKDKIELNKDRDSAKQPQVTDATKMDNTSLAEQVCDWMAMSQEKGTSLKDWADKTINNRWKFNDNQVKTLYELVEFFEDRERRRSELTEDAAVIYKLTRSGNGITESVIDATRTHLDPMIFDKVGDKYSMRPDIIGFLENVVSQINNDIVDVNDYFVKGSILSFQWLDNTDIDLLIETGVSEEDRRRIQDEIDTTFADVDVPSTNHPLQIYINAGKYKAENADGIYRLDTGWVKGPYNISININDYLSKFNKVVGSIDLSTGELKRDIIDYEILKKLPQEEISGLQDKMNGKLKEINGDVENLVFQYKHIRDMRHNAFREDLLPRDIIKYSSKNLLPDNVTFKLLERYYYLKFLRDLKNVIGDGAIKTDSEVDKIKGVIEKSQFGG